MQYAEHRHASRADELTDDFADLEARSGVEVTQGLVEQEEFRTQRQHAGERDALLLAARKFLRTAGGPGFGADEPERLEGAGLDLGGREFFGVERERGVLEDGEVREERVVLVDEPEAAFGGLGEGDVAVIEQNRAALGFNLPGEHLEQGRLAAAGGPQQATERARLHDEVDPREDGRRAELAAQAGEAEGGHGRNLGTSPSGGQGRPPTVNDFSVGFAFPRLPRGRFRAI